MKTNKNIKQRTSWGNTEHLDFEITDGRKMTAIPLPIIILLEFQTTAEWQYMIPISSGI